MKTVELILIILFTGLPLTAKAEIDIWGRCLSAARAGVNVRVERYARILDGSPSIVERDVKRSELCVSASRSELVVYDEVLEVFVPAVQFAKTKATRLNIKTGGADTALPRIIASAELAALEEVDRWLRENRVRARVVEACRELYASDWIAAMTSGICQPIFMETGLPD